MFGGARLGDCEVVEQFRALELDRRRREVELALLVGEVDSRNLYEPDGMRTIESWCRGTVRWTSSEARHAHLVARLLRDHADVMSVDTAITLPVGHLREIARAAANPRCGSQIRTVMPVLLHWGEVLDFAAFRTVVRRFETLADADGTGDDHEESHERRRFSLTPGDVGGHVHGYLGSLQTAIVSEIFERFCQAEFLADWERVKEQRGDDATPSALPRTAAQRRADAFVAMALRAASAPPGSTPPEPFVFVIDYETLTETARRRCANTGADGSGPVVAHGDADADAHRNNNDDDLEQDDDDFEQDDDDLEQDDDDLEQDDVDRSGDAVDPHLTSERPDRFADAQTDRIDGDEAIGVRPAQSNVPARRDPARRDPARRDPAQRRCESGDVTLDPDDVFTAAVLGRIRAIVVDRAGVPIKVGRRSRLFRGPLRDALLATGGRCSCRGCTNRHRLEIDHIIDWQHHGTTDADNGDPRCRWHNNLKNKGFTTWRDPEGIWHTDRPDGTEITSV